MTERIVDILGEGGHTIIGSANVEDAHAQGLLHRSVHVLVINRLGKIFVRRRPTDSPMYAGLWTSSAGTHVMSGDSAEQTAANGLRYFLGLEVPVDFIGETHVQDPYENELITVFRCNADTIPTLNPAGGSEGSFMPETDIKELIINEQTTPHLAAAIALLAQDI